MLERATRLCCRSPRMVTLRFEMVPRRSRIVSASSRPCEGCSWVPSPALITGISRWRATKSAAPEEAWRITRQSGFIAFSVWTVSSSDSPFFTLDDSACRFMVSAPSRDAAVPKLMRVRVEFSKKASATVLPRSVASFFSGWRWISWNGLAWSRRKVISSAESGSRARRSRKRGVTPAIVSHEGLERGKVLKNQRDQSGRSVLAVHEHDALFVIDLAQAHFDDFGIAGLDGATGIL